MNREQDIPAVLETDSGEKVVVRRLSEGDAPALRAFNDDLSKRTESLFLPHCYDDDTLSAYIERSRQDLDRSYVLLAGERIVGYFFLWHFRDPVPVLGIGITDDYQGRGLGKQMMDVLIDDARKAGREAVELTTALDNERAFELYKHKGFRYIRDVDNVSGDGRIIKERHMFLPVNPHAEPTDRQFKPPV